MKMMNRCCIVLELMLMLAFSIYAEDKNVAYVRFKREAIELKTTVDQLSKQFTIVTNDLAEYTAVLNKIEVPMEIMVTNVVRYSASAVCTNIVKKILTVHERKVKRLLLSFDSKPLEDIYCRYFPESNFKRIKADLKEDFAAIKESHAEMLKRRTARRNNSTARISELNELSASQVRKLKERLENDKQKLKRYLETSHRSIGYDSARRNAISICREYGHTACEENLRLYADRTMSQITSRLMALNDNSTLNSRFEVANVVRSEANADVDEESEERFKQDKTACIQRYYDKLSSDFISMLERKKRDIAEQMAIAYDRQSALTSLLNNWDVLDESQIAAMTQDTKNKIVDAVMGSGYSNKEEIAKRKDEQRERMIAIVRDEMDKERKHRERMEEIRSRKSIIIRGASDEEERGELIEEFSIAGEIVFGENLDTFIQRMTSLGNSVVRKQLSRRDSSTLYQATIYLLPRYVKIRHFNVMEVKTNGDNSICAVRFHAYTCREERNRRDAVSAARSWVRSNGVDIQSFYFKNDIIYIGIGNGIYDWPFLDIVRVDLGR